MTDDRYTVDDPPGEGEEVYYANSISFDDQNHVFDWPFYKNDQWNVLGAGLAHRTRESAEAHAKRMLMVDDILEALEMLLRAQDSESPTWREHVTRGARAVAKKARGEVEG